MVTEGNTLCSEKLVVVPEDPHLLSILKGWGMKHLISVLSQTGCVMDPALLCHCDHGKMPKKVMLFNLNKLEIICRMERNLF